MTIAIRQDLTVFHASGIHGLSRMACRDFLSRERTVAPPQLQSLVYAAAALANHHCIGMAHEFSVFWLPLSPAVGRKNVRKRLGFCDAGRDRLRLEDSLARLGVHAFLRLPGLVGGDLRPLAGDVRARKAGLAAACRWCGA